LQRNYPGMPCEFGPLRDSWNYPVHENAFMKGETKEDASREKKVSLNPFTPKEVLAYDVDVSDPSVLNCRSNTNVTGYFKAYFVDVVEDLDIGFDDPDYGLASSNWSVSSTAGYFWVNYVGYYQYKAKNNF